MAFEQVTQQIGQMPQLALQARVAALQEAARQQQLARMDQQQFVQYLTGGIDQLQKGQQRKEDVAFRDDQAQTQKDQFGERMDLDKRKGTAEIASVLARAGVDRARAEQILGMLPWEEELAEASIEGKQAQTQAIKGQEAREGQKQPLVMQGMAQGLEGQGLANEQAAQDLEFGAGRENRYQEGMALENKKFESEDDYRKGRLALEQQSVALDQQQLEYASTLGAEKAASVLSEQRADYTGKATALYKDALRLAEGQSLGKGSNVFLGENSSGPLSDEGKGQFKKLAQRAEAIMQQMATSDNPAQLYSELLAEIPSFGTETVGDTGGPSTDAIRKQAGAYLGG